MVKAIMSAIPIHFMQATRLPKGVTKQIDKMRRSFLWRGNNPCKGIHCLVNWAQVCDLKCNGGLGVIDLDCQNQALLAKWLWKIENDCQGIWSTTLQRLHSITDISQLQNGANSSFFLKQLLELTPFYNSSIRWVGLPKWRWTESGIFTCASAYKMMHNTGVISRYHTKLWKLKAPMKVRIFLWLMFENKILTQEVLTGKGCVVQFGCVLCTSTDMETRDHLFLACPYAGGFWQGLTAELNLPRITETDPLTAWRRGRQRLQGASRQRWNTA